MYVPTDFDGLRAKHAIVERQGQPDNDTGGSITTASPTPTPTPTLAPTSIVTPSDVTNAQPAQQNSQTWTYIVVAVVGVVVLTIALILFYLHLRRRKIAGRSPNYIPTKFLKRKWEAWKPKSKYANIDRRGSGGSEPVATTLIQNETIETTSGVNRNTSVRSIITLPAYSQRPKDDEEVLGREGDRAGIDTVLELPETVDEEEERRESEMESLYQIRQARRREIADREERRRVRREARDQNDWTRLEELRRESRARREQHSLTNLTQNSASNVNLTAEMMIAEHSARGRDGRVSEVSYAQLGQVKHNGTRIRSNSHDSERSGLLNSAAPMGSHTRNGSEATLLTAGGHPQLSYRDRSDSGATSVSLAASSFETITPPTDLTRPLASRNLTSNLTGDSISEVSAEEVDLGSERIITSGGASDDSPQPPDYEGHEWGNAPDYMSRANSTATTRTHRESFRRPVSTISRPDSLSIITPSIIVEHPSGPNTPIARRPIHSMSPVSPVESELSRRS